MSEIIYEFLNNPVVKALTSNQMGVSHLNPQEEAVLMSAAFLRSHRMMVIVKPDAYSAQDLYTRMSTFLPEERLCLFQVEESLQIEAIAASPEMLAQKMETLSFVVHQHKPMVCVTHAGALLRYLPKPNYFKERMLRVAVNETMAMDDLKRQLVLAGYRYSNRVDQPLTFSFRGGVVDVFSIQYDQPLRIEFFDDEIDSIRTFDPSTQRTSGMLEEVTIVPATDLLFTEDELKMIRQKAELKLNKDLARYHDQEDRDELEGIVLRDLEELEEHSFRQGLYRYRGFLTDQATILDYFQQPYVILSDKEEVESHTKRLMEETIQYIQDMFQSNRSLLMFEVMGSLSQVLQGHSTYEIGKFEDMRHSITSHVQPLFLPDLPFSRLTLELKKMAETQRVLLCLKEEEIKKAIEGFVEAQVSYEMVMDQLPSDPGIYIRVEYWLEGLRYESNNLTIVSATELFHTKPIRGRYASKFKDAQVLGNHTDLQIGDYVVHQQHGIGRYLGIVTKEIEGVKRDYLHIAYKGDDVLLVPLEQFQLVRKFVGGEGFQPKMNKLGTNDWKKTKEKLQSNVEEIAERLIKLYAARNENIGFAFSEDGELQQEFEAQFEYDLTKDQATAIDEVKADMMLPKPMDRLLCGDVGFGKTEVALRAAFKAVLDHKQVAYLCPTTILSRQHYHTFLRRLEGYPVQVALLNRFVDVSEQKRIIKGIRDGTIDIVIGTHRVLSKDIEYKDLGLLIIDEEQRFGVEAKEKIKEIKNSIDVLSLSATPIPRTLQMSLIGVRGLSQLQTAPQRRMPVQTYVIEKSPSIVREVIQRELARNGQVFYLYNDTMEIYQVAHELERKIPSAKVAVAHGKMSKEEIEDVMFKFTDNEYNVLVCTTIIETGIDIPNANTILIDQADRFGLAQLYQIKGRVGRSDRVAYAYLMYNGLKQLNEVATKRLQAIKDFTELGSGYKIAMRDLSIRGAGDLLGAKQAGFINTVGMDMYVEMLHDAIELKKGIAQKPEEVLVKKSDVKVDAYMPKQYAPQDSEKLQLYQRINTIKNEKALEQLEQEVIDRYGVNPRSIQLLFDKRRMDILSNNDKIDEIKEGKKEVSIVLSNAWSQNCDGVKFFEEITKISVDIRLKYEKGHIILVVSKKLDWLKLVNQVLDVMKKF